VGEGRLPASGTAVWLREATGEDELLVLHGAGPGTVTVLALAQRLTSGADGQPLDWHALPAVDLGASALLIREAWLGSTIRTEALCSTPACSTPIDIAFNVPAYLEHHRPRRLRGAVAAQDGWFTLRGGEAGFRIPTIADLLAARAGGGREALLERCVRPVGLPRAVIERVDRALAALAPRLDGLLSGTCPECGQAVELHFEPVGYVLEELRAACAGLYGQVHELALSYHWSEAAILALDRRRRQTYVGMIRGELVLA
jgi:hypothetical protein